MDESKKKYFLACSVLIGSCIGAGFLGLPYVASKSGFFVVLFYLIFLGFIMYFANAFLGEVILRTKGNHQLIGYAKRYLGKKYSGLMTFALVFGMYSALIAYLLGMGESLSYLFFGNLEFTFLFGLFVGILMGFLLKGGISSLKKFEKFGVLFIFFVLGIIFFSLIFKINFSNLIYFEFSSIFLPFGIVLFSLINFHSIPEVSLILNEDKKYFLKVLKTSTIVCVTLYAFFIFFIFGYLGKSTPEVATLSLGTVFVILGILTMFTSYFAAGNALREAFSFDEKCSPNLSWFLASFVPILFFILIQIIKGFSFTKILSVGGVVSGGMIAILSLIMANRAKILGTRKPEYSIDFPKFLFWALFVLFFVAVLFEIL